MEDFITAIDYGIMKTKDANKNHFLSTFTIQKPDDNKDIIVTNYDGESYYIGNKVDADFNVNINKSLFSNSKILIYTMLAKYMPLQYNSVKLFTCIPLNQNSKDNVIRYSRNICPNNDDLIRVTVDGKYRQFKIKEVRVFPECAAAYYNLPKMQKGLIVDIGGRTVNCALYENGKLIKSRTYTKGLLTLYTLLQSELTKKYGSEEGLLDMDFILENGYYPDRIGGDVIINKCLESYAKDLYTTLLIDFTLSYDVFLVGGGSVKTSSAIKMFIKQAVLSPTAEWDNVLGLGVIARKWWV